tara:strand:- start:251 stop:427 length:177 start_codon:yes stop_codon:yes gene_type:complete
VKRVWIVLNNDGTTIICDSKQEMDCYANLSSTQKLEGPYMMSEEQIKQEQDYSVEVTA